MRAKLLTLIVPLVFALTAQAADRPQLMVLGSAHLANHFRDLVNVRVEDVLTPRRQAEMNAMIDRLVAFRPTHVAVEWPSTKQAGLDERYAAYLKGDYALSADEVDQVGLRLAKKLGLKRVDAVDWNEDAPGKDEDYDFIAWAKAHGKQKEYDAFIARSKALGADEPEFNRTHTITEWYLRFNSPETVAAYGRPYFDYPLFGDDTANPGAAWVGQWYARNLRIFTHIRALAASPHDRIFVVYGAGHGPHLRKDAIESGLFDLVEPSAYLAASP